MRLDQDHRVDEVILAFTHSSRQQASNCNSKLGQLLAHTIFPAIGEAFDQVGKGDFALEFEKLEIDLGVLEEEDISENLGYRIHQELVSKLKKLIHDRISLDFGVSHSPNYSSKDLYIGLLNHFLLKGYFPSWIDPNLSFYKILDQVILHFPADLGKLIGEVSRKSESSRKRIANLKDPYFDRIIQVLVPEDAQWVLGYRNSYLQIHRSESTLQGSAENLKNALNLFILTFITDSSGTKFNRLNFSDRFLKAIASHYNLDFKLFLQEITEIVNQKNLENPLFKDFKEALIWVNEKNQADPVFSEIPYEPSFNDIISWLESPKEKNPIAVWLENFGGVDGLFPALSSRFPSFWNSLSSTGLTNLLKFLGGNQSDKWLKLTYSYLAWNARMRGNGTKSQAEVVKEIFELRNSISSKRFLSMDLQGWYSSIVYHAFSKFVPKKETFKDLIEIGFEFGIANPSQILLATKNHLECTGFVKKERVSVDLPDPITFSNSQRIQESTLVEYLISGSTSSLFNSINESDLLEILGNMIQTLNPGLLRLIRDSNISGDRGQISRSLKLLKKLNQLEVITYLEKFGDSYTLILLELNKVIQSKEHQEKILQLAWIGLIEKENFGKLNSGNSLAHLYGKSLSLLNFYHFHFASGFGKSLISHTFKTLEAGKSSLLFFALKSSTQARLISQFERVISTHLLVKSRGGLMNLKKIRSQDLSLFKEFYLPKSNNHLSKIGRLNQLIQARFDSTASLILSDKFSKSELEKDLAWILKSDLKNIITCLYSGKYVGSYKVGLKEYARRIFLISQFFPHLLDKSLSRNQTQVPLVLFALHQSLSAKDWRVLSTKLNSKFPSEFRMARIMIEKGFESFLENLEGNKNPNASHFLLSNSWEVTLGKWEKIGSWEWQEDIVSPKENQQFHALFDLPESVFYKKSTAITWKRGVLFSAYLSSIRNELGKESVPASFWKRLQMYLKAKKSDFGPEHMDWHYLLNSSQIGPELRTKLLQFFKNSFLKIGNQGVSPSHKESISSAIIHLKVKGFIPWWSPIKSKINLVSSLLFLIEHAESEDAYLLIHLINDGGFFKTIEKIHTEDLQKILYQLSKSHYRKYYKEVIQKIEGRLNTDALRLKNAEEEQRVKIPNQPKSISAIKLLSPAALEQWIERQINASKEYEIVEAWFAGDPRIHDQVQELLRWGRFMYYGKVNPGDWKQKLLRFGFEFYIQKGNSYSSNFLSKYLSFLFKSQNLINWKLIFQQLLKNKEFVNQLSKPFKEQILSALPPDQPQQQEMIHTGDRVNIKNAGLILCWPFLPALFSRLNMSSRGVILPEFQSKAVFLLQYLVFGQVDFPEYELVLNKILVGLKPSQHLEFVELSQEEMETAESLLQGMKANWDKMKNASPDAIRETFLQRSGELEFGSASNLLRIQKTGVDVLLESISWNISVVKLPWMEKSLEVKWK